MNIPEPKQQPSGKWMSQIMVNGKRRAKTFDTREEAVYWAAGVKTKAMEEQEKCKDMTLEFAMSKYIEDRSNILSPATIKSYTNFQENYFESLKKKKSRPFRRVMSRKKSTLCLLTKRTRPSRTPSPFCLL